MSGEVLEEDGVAEEADAGVPAWVMTFADLMTLLMCFFVLLLAFSEMDVLKFKQLSGSVREAFGVQTEIEAKTIPKGTSIIAQEFSPGIPEPTPLNVVRQFTMETDRNSLDFEADDEILEDKRRRERAAQIAAEIRAKLGLEIAEGNVDVRLEGKRVVIQLLEKATFRSGFSDISKEFDPVLGKIAGILRGTEGEVHISGHSDNIPIRNARYRSNWDLSSARAVTVLEALLKLGRLDPKRFVASGHADTVPLADNLTAGNRSKNRRVDITIIQSGDLLTDKQAREQAQAEAEAEAGLTEDQDLAQDVAPGAEAAPNPDDDLGVESQTAPGGTDDVG